MRCSFRCDLSIRAILLDSNVPIRPILGRLRSLDSESICSKSAIRISLLSNLHQPLVLLSVVIVRLPDRIQIELAIASPKDSSILLREDAAWSNALFNIRLAEPHCVQG